MIESSNEMIWTLDTAGCFTFCNGAAERTIGLHFADWEGKACVSLIVDEDIPEATDIIDQTLKGGSCNHELRLRKTDSTVIIISVNSAPLRVNGGIEGIVCFARDVTKQKETERILVENETRFSALFRNSSHPIIIIDIRKSCFSDVNEAFVKQYGFSREDLIGRNAIEIGLIDAEVERESRRLIMEQGIFSDREVTVTTKSGHRRTGLASGRIIIVDNSPYLIQTIIDITERTAAETKIRQLLEEKELTLKEVHHRIKNNMNAIYGLLSLQADSLEDAVAAAALREAGDRVQSMQILYDRLYQSSTFTVLPIRNYFLPLIDEIMSHYPHRSAVRIESRIDDFSLEATRLQPLGIIINELLTNIMKYAFSDRTDGTVSITACKTGGTVTLTVGDDGGGMPDTVSFDRPSGFGLILVQGLAMQLGGTVRMERGKGTRFVLEFAP